MIILNVYWYVKFFLHGIEMMNSNYLIESVNYIKTSLMYVVLITTKNVFICNTCLQYETILNHGVTNGMIIEILLPIKFTKLISINDQLVSSFLVWNKVMYPKPFAFFTWIVKRNDFEE